jgi:hypothetical protein
MRLKGWLLRERSLQFQLIEKHWGDSGMAKRQKKIKQVVSIEAYRQSRTRGVGTLTSQTHLGQWYADFVWKDWSTLLAQLKTEISEIDRAILALTKLAMGRSQPFLNQANAPERKQGRR